MRRLAPLLAAGLLMAGCAPADPTTETAGEAAPETAGGARTEAPQEVAGARGGFVDTEDGERIHYLEVGPTAEGEERPSLFFIPGWSLAAEIWEPQLEHFGQTHRTVAMDPRAQGRSSKAREGLYAAARARDIRAVVESLDLEPVVLVGWSMGVTEVVAYVEQFGTDGVTALVLVDGLAGLDFEPPLARQFLDLGAAYVHDRRGTTEAFARSLFRTERSDDYLEAVTEQALRTPTDAAVALAVGQARSDHRAALPNIDRPTLIAVAPGGPWTDHYGAMAEAIPGARLEWFEGAGHALFVDQAERFNAVLEEFLAEVEGRPAR